MLKLNNTQTLLKQENINSKKPKMKIIKVRENIASLHRKNFAVKKNNLLGPTTLSKQFTNTTFKKCSTKIKDTGQKTSEFSINKTYTIKGNNNIPKSSMIQQKQTEEIKETSSLNVVNKKLSRKSGLPTLKELQKRLNSWLEKRGKDRNNFKYLINFNEESKKPIQYSSFDEENKENIEIVDESSWENLNIYTKDDKKTTKNLKEITHKALNELNLLIKKGYTRQHCSDWLDAILEVNENVVSDPNYWECKASLEQSYGHVIESVECYKKAIFHGAEVDDVTVCLDNLMKNFNLLNIECNNNKKKNSKDSKERTRILQEARNIFKSSVIQCAICEKTMRKKNVNNKNIIETKTVATPIRRSTRLSRTGYTKTPNMKILNTFQSITENSNFIEFQTNNALLK